HAVRALLHHAAIAHGDVRVGAELAERIVRLEIEPVEPADLVRAVVRAEPRADAAVVGHLVQTLEAVRGRRDRAHVFARRLLAVLARHRLDDGRAGRVDVAIDADPVHVAAAADLVLADDRRVVLGRARHHARRAAGAR